jgi:hypothetical protein
VRPVLTGRRPIEGRGAPDDERIVELDRDCVANRSTGGDPGILAGTVFVVLPGRAAH